MTPTKTELDVQELEKDLNELHLQLKDALSKMTVSPPPPPPSLKRRISHFVGSAIGHILGVAIWIVGVAALIWTAHWLGWF